MSRTIQWVKTRVSLRYWAYIHAFLAFGIGWGHAIIFAYPIAYNGVVDIGLVYRMGILTAFGSIVAVVGLFMSRALTQKTQHFGLWIELVGVTLMVGGALQYFSIQLGFVISGDEQRYATTWLAYTLCAFVSIRIAAIIPFLIESGRQARIASARQSLRDAGGVR